MWIGQIRTQAKLGSKVYTVFYAWRNCFFLPGPHAKNVCLGNALIYSSIGIKLSLVIVFIRIYVLFNPAMPPPAWHAHGPFVAEMQT